MKLPENFWTTNEISHEAHFCENQTKVIRTKGLKNFQKIFVELFVRYLQTNCKFIFQNMLRFNGY